MSNFATWFKEVIHFTLPGSIYLISGLLYYQILSNNILSLNCVIDCNNILLIFIALVFISFILGLSIHYSLQRILWLIFPKYLDQFKNDIAKDKIDLQIIRRPMIMYRHLIISSIFLCVSTIWYLRKNNYNHIFLILSVFIVCLIIFTLAYLYLRKSFIESKKLLKK
jgi:hypothetical protein